MNPSNRARELDPFSLAISAQRGFLLENARRYDEAIEQLRGVIAMDPSHYQAHWILGHTYAANKQFNELNKSRYVTPAALVNVYIGLGDKEQAFAWLEKAFQERSNYLASKSISNPRSAPLGSTLRRSGSTNRPAAVTLSYLKVTS